MEVLKYSQFILESLNNSNKEIEKIGDDGFLLRACDENIGSEDGSNLFFSDQDENSFCLYFHGDRDETKNKILIPKTAAKIEDRGQNKIIIFHPENKWMSKDRNLEIIEDFIENFLGSKLENKENQKIGFSEVEEDLIFLLDCLGLEFKIESLKQNQKDSFEIFLEKSGKIDLFKKSPRCLYSELRFYPNPENIESSLIIKKNKDRANFECYPEQFTPKFFSCYLDEVPRHPYYNFLVKKSLGQHVGDEAEKLLDYFLEILSKQGSSPSDTSANEEESRRHLREIKSVLASVLPLEKLSLLSPSKI